MAGGGYDGTAGRSPVSLDAVDIALLLTYCTAWLAVIAAVALF